MNGQLKGFALGFTLCIGVAGAFWGHNATAQAAPAIQTSRTGNNKLVALTDGDTTIHINARLVDQIQAIKVENRVEVHVFFVSELTGAPTELYNLTVAEENYKAFVTEINKLRS